ncbi:MAG: TIGR03790 family protein [Opitutus sp.]
MIVVANSASPDSVTIAQHYATGRSIPVENIIALAMPEAETIEWEEFVRMIWNPLEAELVKRNWIEGVAMQLADGVGRKKYFVSGHRISYLVLCRGVPLRIKSDPSRYASELTPNQNPIFRTNAGSVDGELALLAFPNHEINGYLVNPLFDNDRPSRRQLNEVVRVSRLDGPSAEDVLGLCDRAIEAERTGLVGRAYVDLGGIHPDGDRWLERTADETVAAGFDTDVDRSPNTYPATHPLTSPAFYFGWYASSLNGPFAVEGFRFPIGAIALHIHSFSATTLRNTTSGWCGPLIARGVTATLGNVYEPYLQLTHRPDLLMRALACGDNFGDAVCCAQPALSWQLVAIGDPLYRPFRSKPEGAKLEGGLRPDAKKAGR